MKIQDYKEVFYLWENTEGMGLSNADTYENIESFLSRNEKLSLVYTINNEIVGTVLCGHDGRRGYIYHLAVKEEHRGKTIGSKLMINCLSNLKKYGIFKCHLFVIDKNELGKTFWERSQWNLRDDIVVFSKEL